MKDFEQRLSEHFGEKTAESIVAGIVITLLLLVIAAIVIFVPFAIVFTINLLFGVTIPYTVFNWFMAFILICLFFAFFD